MAIVSFLGFDCPSVDFLMEKIIRALDEIVQKTETIEYRFFEYNPFIAVCWSAAWATKLTNPAKNVKLLQVKLAGEAVTELLNTRIVTSDNLSYEVDGVLFSEFPLSGGRESTRLTKQWLAEHVTHIVCNLDADADPFDLALLQSAKDRGATVYNLAE